MEELQKENTKLKDKVKRLTEENERLEKLVVDILGENKYLKDKVRTENKARIHYISFKSKPKPTLCLDHAEVEFKTPGSNTVRLLKGLFESKTIERMKEEPVPIDELHDLIYGEDTEGDWFSLNNKQREKAKSDIRGLFRIINNEAKVKLNGESLFIPDDNGFKLNKKVLF